MGSRIVIRLLYGVITGCCAGRIAVLLVWEIQYFLPYTIATFLEMGGGTLEKPEDYQISVCGVYWLDYENGEVTGAIDNGTTSLSLNEFKQYHSTCSPTGIEEQIPAITLYPNPIKGILTIEGLKGKKALYDSYGRLVKSTQTSTLDISQEASGIYLLKLTDEQGTVYSQKVVKE